MSFSINKLLTAILVIMVVGIVLMFLFKINVQKYVGFLPDFGDFKEDKIIDDRIRGIGEEEVKNVETPSVEGDSVDEEVIEMRCVGYAFWANAYKDVIKEGAKIEPGKIFLGLEIVDVDKCEEVEVIFNSNLFEKYSRQPKQSLHKLHLDKMENNGNFYYIDYEVEDIGLGSSGEYSFDIIDGSGEIIFPGYQIKVEKYGILK